MLSRPVPSRAAYLRNPSVCPPPPPFTLSADLIWLADLIVTLNADLCIQFDTSLLDLVNSNNNDSLAFYIRCDEDSTLNNPMAEPMRTLSEALDEGSRAREALTTLVDDEICKNNVTTQCTIGLSFDVSLIYGLGLTETLIL